LFNPGVRLAEANCLIEAIKYFTRAIELDPQQPSPFNNRAQAYQLQNNTKGKYREKNSRDMAHNVL
jgi:tetratricopeptide (TPR) repeat protein